MEKKVEQIEQEVADALKNIGISSPLIRSIVSIVKNGTVVEEDAADALLDIGISVPLIRIKFPFMKPRYIRATMKRPTLASLIRISKIYRSMGVTYKDLCSFTKEQEFEFIAKHGKKVAKIAALMMLRGSISAFLFGWIYQLIILLFVKDDHLCAISRQCIPLLNTKAFSDIIKSVEAANPLTPRMSQENKGS